MKTAISIDAQLLQAADRAAKQIGLSRSRLFSVAVEDYLRRRRRAQIVDELNKVYSTDAAPEELRTIAKLKTKFHSTVKERW